MEEHHIININEIIRINLDIPLQGVLILAGPKYISEVKKTRPVLIKTFHMTFMVNFSSPCHRKKFLPLNYNVCKYCRDGLNKTIDIISN